MPPMPAAQNLDYRQMMEDALRGVIRRAMQHAADHGLPGDHHFFVGFHTDRPGVVLPGSLRRKYPGEMTIILQYQFQDLQVDEEGFSVTLQFDAVPKRLTVPFSAVTSFADPSASFGLRFEAADQPGEGPASPDGEDREGAPVPPAAPRGEVVPFSRAGSDNRLATRLSSVSTPLSRQGTPRR